MSEPERLTLLEERYAHLQRHVTQQDKAMLELTEELAKLRRELAAFRDRLADIAEGGTGPSDERPPHY